MEKIAFELEKRKVEALEKIALWLKIGVWLAVSLVGGIAISALL
ncbi:hypothetical protein [Vibrio tubiashii]|nr:hypothetical protein [Vibrio tubiashii]